MRLTISVLALAVICLSQGTSGDKVHPSHVQRHPRHSRPVTLFRRPPIYARQFKLQAHPKQQPLGRSAVRKPLQQLRPRAASHYRSAPSTGLSSLFSNIARRFANKRESRYAFGRLAGARLSAASSPSASRPAFHRGKYVPSGLKKYYKSSPKDHRRRFKTQRDPNAPKFYYQKAEDIPGYQKFTLDEVIYPEETNEAEARSDVSANVITYVDSPSKTEKEDSKSSEEAKEGKEEEVDNKVEVEKKESESKEE